MLSTQEGLTKAKPGRRRRHDLAERADCEDCGTRGSDLKLISARCDCWACANDCRCGLYTCPNPECRAELFRCEACDCNRCSIRVRIAQPSTASSTQSTASLRLVWGDGKWEWVSAHELERRKLERLLIDGYINAAEMTTRLKRLEAS